MPKKARLAETAKVPARTMAMSAPKGRSVAPPPAAAAVAIVVDVSFVPYRGSDKNDGDACLLQFALWFLFPISILPCPDLVWSGISISAGVLRCYSSCSFLCAVRCVVFRDIFLFIFAFRILASSCLSFGFL